MASGCENVTARCEVICSPFWNILMLRRITMAAKGNCDPPQRTAKSRAASDPVGVPIYSPPFDPSLAPQHDGESMHIKLFALFYTGNRCYCRVEQIHRSYLRGNTRALCLPSQTAMRTGIHHYPVHQRLRTAQCRYFG